LAPTVLPAFQTWRLVAVGSVSDITMIDLQWPNWPSEERCGSDEQECLEAPADQLEPFVKRVANGGFGRNQAFDDANRKIVASHPCDRARLVTGFERCHS